MANGLYTKWLNGQLGAGSYTPIDFATPSGNGLKLALIDGAGADGAADTVNDDFWDDQDGSIVGPLSSALGSLDVGGIGAGVVDAANLAPAWTGLTGASAEEMVLLLDSGTPATSPLVCYWGAGTTGLPLTPNSGDVNVTFSGSGLFKI